MATKTKRAAPDAHSNDPAAQATARAPGGKKKMTDAEKKQREEFLANESKAARFKRLGEPRIKKAINSIRLVGNLSGGGYEYTPEQIDHIESLLASAVKETMAKFKSGPSKRDVQVTL